MKLSIAELFPLDGDIQCNLLQLLNVFNLTNAEFNRGFLMETQNSVTGGFSKWPDHTPGKNYSSL